MLKVRFINQAQESGFDVREQFFLAAAAQNVKRLVRFLSQPITPIGEATT